MTTAYKREPCGHEQVQENCISRDLLRIPKDASTGTNWVFIDCTGFTYVPWPELEAELKQDYVDKLSVMAEDFNRAVKGYPETIAKHERINKALLAELTAYQSIGTPEELVQAGIALNAYLKLGTPAELEALVEAAEPIKAAAGWASDTDPQTIVFQSGPYVVTFGHLWKLRMAMSALTNLKRSEG